MTGHKPLGEEKSDMNSDFPLYNSQLPDHASILHSNNLKNRCITESPSVNRGSSSTSSSLNGDTSSDLLSEVIQSAMPKSGQMRLSNLCPVIDPTSSDGDCLQMYALEGTPGINDDDLSGSSSIPNDEVSIHSVVASEISNSLSIAPTSSLSKIAFQMLNADPPTPPLRTTSALTSSSDPFSKVSGLTRPRATVAPMLQTKSHSLNSPIVSRSQNVSEQSLKSCLQPDESERNDCAPLPNSSLPSSSSPSHYIGADKDDASSFSSLLSIESVGMEHSLLQECISSAMPRPKSISHLRKQQQQQQFNQHQKQKRQQSSPSTSSSPPPAQVTLKEEEEEEEKSNHHLVSSRDIGCFQPNEADDIHCHQTSSSKIQVYQPPATPSSLSGSNSKHSQSSLSSKKSSQQKQQSKIPSQNLHKTIAKSNGSSQGGTIHFLDHGSGDAQPPPCLNTNVAMKNTITASDITTSSNPTITTDFVVINSNNNTRKLPVLNQDSCASYGGRIPNADSEDYKTSKLSLRSNNYSTDTYSSQSLLPTTIQLSKNCNKVAIHNNKSGLRAPSIKTKPNTSNTLNDKHTKSIKHSNVIDILDPKDIIELLQKGAETVVTDLMKSCQYEVRNDPSDELKNDSHLDSNASSLELLPELIDLDRPDALFKNNLGNNNHKTNEVNYNEPVDTSIKAPSSTGVTSRKPLISSSNTPLSNIQSVNYNPLYSPSVKTTNPSKPDNTFKSKLVRNGIPIVSRAASGKVIGNFSNQIMNNNVGGGGVSSKNRYQPTTVKHINHASNINTTYKYKKGITHVVAAVNNTYKIPNQINNNNNGKKSTKYIKQQNHHQRSAMTEPPSVQNRSLATSRSVSAASLISNPKSINQSNESNIIPPHNLVKPSNQHMSAESIYAALVKQDKLRNQHRHNNYSNNGSNNNNSNMNSKLITKTSSVGIYAKCRASNRSSISGTSHFNHSIGHIASAVALASSGDVGRGMMKTKSFEAKQNHSLQGSNDCIPINLSYDNSSSIIGGGGEGVSNTPVIASTAELSGSTATTTGLSKCDNNSNISDIPKPIRGGRKSLTGRKITSPQTTNPTNAIPIPVKPISAVRPTPHSFANLHVNPSNIVKKVDQQKPKGNLQQVNPADNSSKQIADTASEDVNSGNAESNVISKYQNDDYSSVKQPPGMWIVREELSVIVDDFD
ncbi:unnamed protein product [Heterobilharzia americana]|nr:unnamed protein product [Heterobilharzia americana]